MRYGWIIATYTDHGQLNRRVRICRHYSEETAAKAWKRISRWHGPRSNATGTGSSINWRVWQERRHTNEIINDTGSYGYKSYTHLVY
jgi:hypothetical protein